LTLAVNLGGGLVATAVNLGGGVWQDSAPPHPTRRVGMGVYSGQPWRGGGGLAVWQDSHTLHLTRQWIILHVLAHDFHHGDEGGHLSERAPLARIKPSESPPN